ncbi:hypothetical protein AYI69_g7092, partial [Smittium culicis]
TRRTAAHDMVIQPGPFKLKGPVTEPRELEILVLDKNVDTEKKYNLDSDAEYKQFRKDPANLGYPESKYQGTRYYTPGSALRKPLNTVCVDRTTEEKILESARAVRDKAETKQSDFVLLAPAPFYGHWKENANTWIQRFIRHVDSTKRPLLNEELVEYVGYQLEGRAKWWHRSASQLYPDWEQYVEAFIYEFHPSKNKKIAQEKLKEFKIYNGDLLENYANIVSIFKVLGTTDVDEQVDILLEKLNRQDRETVVQLNLLTTFQIFDLLIGRKERDRRFGSTQSRREGQVIAENSEFEKKNRRIEFASAVKETRSCYKCDKIGHLSGNCPSRFESRRLEFNPRNFGNDNRKFGEQRRNAVEFTPVNNRMEFGNKSQASRAKMLESRMKRLGGTEKNGEVNALQIGTNQKLKSGEYTGIGGLLKINNKHIPWQLDTGAGFNVISDQLAKELGLGESKNESESAVLVSANGTKNSSRSIRNVEVEFSGLKTTADFYTMTTGRKNLLLIGLQTLQELGATVDLQNEKIKMRKSGKTYEVGLKYIHKGDIPKIGSTIYTLEKDRLDGEFISKDLRHEKRKDIINLVWSHKDVFAEELEDLGIADVPSCEIKLMDERPIKLQLFAKDIPRGRVGRWALKLRNYSFDIVHKDGKKNPADFLSRYPTTEGESEVLAINQADHRAEYKHRYESTIDKLRSDGAEDETRNKFYEKSGELYYKEGIEATRKWSGREDGPRSETENKETDLPFEQKLGFVFMASSISHTNKHQSKRRKVSSRDRVRFTVNDFSSMGTRKS